MKNVANTEPLSYFCTCENHIALMEKKRFSIRDYIAWGFLAAAAILLGLSLSITDNPRNSDRIAAKTSGIITKRMNVLEGYISQALTGDKAEWMSQMNLPDDMIIYRYIDDTLQSWRNQFPVINDDISSRVLFQRITQPMTSLASPLAEVTEQAKFVNYGQKWYLVKSEILGSRRVIAGLEISNSADEGTPNGVNKRLKLSRDYQIAPLSESGGSVARLQDRPVFKIINSTLNGRSIVAHSTLTWFALACFIIASLLYLSDNRSQKRLLAVLSGLFVVMLAAYLWGENIKDSSKLFSPTIYADGQFFNSLGTVVIFSLLIVLSICCVFVTRRDIYRVILRARDPKLSLIVNASCLAAIIAGLMVYIHVIFRSVILNSSISLELYKLNDLNFYSLVVYLILFSLLMTIPLLFHLFLTMVKRISGGHRRDVFSVTGRALFAVCASAYLVITAASLGFNKEQDRVNVWANRLSMDRDISLELELRLQEDKIASDQLIATLSVIQNSNYIILNRIVENYLFRISQDYDVMVELFPENEKDPSAIAYFTDMVSNGTLISEDSKFRYLRDANGHNLYVGSFAYYSSDHGITMMLLTVSPKSNREDKGYASLLGYSAPGDVLIPAKYSYAKYASSKLSSYKGNYAYPTALDDNLKSELLDAPKDFVRMNGYVHFVNGVSNNDIILITRPETDDFNYFVAFLFLTLTFYFSLSSGNLLRRGKREKEKNYYKSKINAAMMLALIMTLIALASVSVLFVYKRNNSNQMSVMSDKVNSLQTLLQARCRFAQDFTALNSQDAANIIEDISNTMKSDITLYTTSGKEFRSTTPEVFDRMLLGSRINQDAFENIIYKSKRYFINRETIGSRKTYFLYAPLFNAQGKMIAIMGSPFTDESFDFKSEAVLHSITIVTVFMILLLLARFITATAVDKMFKPLSEMGRKMNEAKINNLEYIVYERDDEVSSLVRAYNLMVHDLYNSTKQLTQAERDKAWATMARQVAHEIKNPLTPIKLQIQRLIRMKSVGNNVWTDKFDEVSAEVLKQIDLLADTANEFSTFAKLYSEDSVEIDLDKLLKEEIDLFDSKENIAFSYMGLDKAKVIGPKPQLTRVIVNLIGNAIQAIENAQSEERDNRRETFIGRVLVSLRLSSKDGFYDIVFEDNGPGVSDDNRSKLFTPNFTTKSNGTGLGLSICRNIIEKCNGEILYSKSFTLKGACFTVRLPRP